MLTIHKYPLPTCNQGDIATIRMPHGSEVIRVDEVGGIPFIWAVVKDSNPLVDKEFHLYKTGANMDKLPLLWQGVTDEESSTFQFCGCVKAWAGGEELCYYVFEGEEVWVE